MRRLLASVLLAGGVAVAGCRKPPGTSANSNEIVIGEYASLTGSTATFGTSCDKGVELALDEANAAGGINGKKIRIVVEDDESKQEEAVNAVQKLISRDNVCAVLGEVASSRSLAAGTVCQKSKIPMLSPASTNPRVTQEGDYIFRACFTDDFQGMINGRFAIDQGWKKVAVMTEVSSDYSQGLTAAFRGTYDKSGQVIKSESYREDDRDYKAQLEDIKTDSPDAVFLPGYYTNVNLILNQAHQLGLNVPFFGGDGWDSPETVKNPDASGNYYSDHYSADDPNPQTQKFVQAYRAKYNNETPDAMAVLGYDAARVMFDAIKRAGSTNPAAIRDALAQTKDFPGASGSITIGPDRNAQKPIVILQVESGKANVVQKYSPSGEKEPLK